MIKRMKAMVEFDVNLANSKTKDPEADLAKAISSGLLQVSKNLSMKNIKIEVEMSESEKES